MIMQTPQLVKTSTAVSQVRRWNRTTQRYEWVTITQQMIEADRRRQQYVAQFNPCDVA